MVNHIIRTDILLIARIFPRPFGAGKNTTQLTKYPRVLYVKPSNKYILFAGREVRIEKNCARGLEYGPRPQAVLRKTVPEVLSTARGKRA